MLEQLAKENLDAAHDVSGFLNFIDESGIYDRDERLTLDTPTFLNKIGLSALEYAKNRGISNNGLYIILAEIIGPIEAKRIWAVTQGEYI